jgi:hypothetical protein
MTTNRIVNAIARMKAQIADRIAKGLVTADKVEESRKALDLEWADYVKFQELKSLASVNGQLTLDEAMTVYNYLGEGGPDKFNRQPVEVKWVLTQLLRELLAAKIKAA